MVRKICVQTEDPACLVYRSQQAVKLENVLKPAKKGFLERQALDPELGSQVTLPLDTDLGKAPSCY